MRNVTILWCLKIQNIKSKIDREIERITAWKNHSVCNNNYYYTRRDHFLRRRHVEFLTGSSQSRDPLRSWHGRTLQQYCLGPLWFQTWRVIVNYARKCVWCGWFLWNRFSSTDRFTCRRRFVWTNGDKKRISQANKN